MASLSLEEKKSKIEGLNSELRPSNARSRPFIQSKFIYVGDEKLYIKGVSYGAFEPDKDGNEYQDKDKLRQDFRQMAASGINTVRIPHTNPPLHLLDIAYEEGLWVMAGLSAEQYVGYLIDDHKAPDLESMFKAKVRSLKDHPALLCFGLGNEIPASMARWIGKKRIEAYLKKAYTWVKEEAPDSIVTYVNYPTTEYIDLPFLDMLCFNVYLEKREDFEIYLSRLQNLAGDRPLLMGEVGLDAMRNGEEKQAEFLQWQIESTFNSGCVGLFIFSWTDEWFRGGEEVYDWEFGLTRKDRSPKPSLEKVKESFQKHPFPQEYRWPMISVILCSYNGEKTISQALDALTNLNYPNYELLVINDGSTDNTAQIAESYPVKLINIKSSGLSKARNTGLFLAKGEIVAYLDDDAYPEKDWLHYLALSFRDESFSAFGGPNLVPPDAPFMETCIDYVPGNPTHILLSDRLAEHIPGCNMAFRKELLQEIGGFDEQFVTAGDDVDVCWRLQERGLKIGYSPAAIVWHHRRPDASKFWKQQSGYGRSEAMLEKKWPQKYNSLGHHSWSGRIYGNGNLLKNWMRSWRVYHGTWGLAPFQSIYEKAGNPYFAILSMPESYLVFAGLAILSVISFAWSSLLFSVPLLAFFLSLLFIHTGSSVSKIQVPRQFAKSRISRWKFRFRVFGLRLMQPLARLHGRIRFDLTPWRRFGKRNFRLSIPKTQSVWCEYWISLDLRLRAIAEGMKTDNFIVHNGGDWDEWDVEIQGGNFGKIFMIMAGEDHTGGKQYLRFRSKAVFTKFSKILMFIFGSLGSLALWEKEWIFLAVFGGLFLTVLIRSLNECASAAVSCATHAQAQSELETIEFSH